MPAQSREHSSAEPGSGESLDRHGSPVTPADHDLLDEDSLLEEQPYASLEEELVTYANPEDDVEGPGSW
ncbi:MAG: hypothetical protein HY829_13810 [Actinobacteria bacterium]|nr:hypothetical protein [Actinomycetota bacterium]